MKLSTAYNKFKLIVVSNSVQLPEAKQSTWQKHAAKKFRLKLLYNKKAMFMDCFQSDHTKGDPTKKDVVNELIKTSKNASETYNEFRRRTNSSDNRTTQSRYQRRCDIINSFTRITGEDFTTIINAEE